MALLMREAIGDSLRRLRTARKRTLRDVSRNARVSLGYLSEVERGRKEPSSELLAAICEALDVSLADLLVDAAGAIGASSAPRFPVGFRNDHRTDHRDRRLVLADTPVESRPAAPVSPVVPSRAGEKGASAVCVAA
ncbi:Transcriptional regulator, contains XRE-family HTH domain [Pseudonocardia thermophila]|jgi:Predicted transcriptional regulators|uniref:Transcriptional regulator, contains XRE-family HTH domain n=1 Tax=Pseudonocardia thermophila TaxID=1848 RepID=A0A1M6QXZ0_PSETH|nr:helix-turn-helix transcriptional regulator [Pseudonocardia thermophila]SHK25010.1 Transcriptional regulator, contains XRE-family HTH domain [Pseudonocardia thermophila]